MLEHVVISMVVDIKFLSIQADVLSAEGWDARSLSNHANLDEKDIISDIAVGYALDF